MGDHSISVIYPPPELRNIVDKTASFVARNGPEFETRIQQNEPNNPKFNFLKPGDPYNAYYQFKVKELRENGTNGSSSVPANSAANQSAGAESESFAAAEPANNSTISQNATAASATPIQKATKQLENFMEIPIITRDPPPAFEFSDDPPSISAFDLDIVKLTAQFVAIHGRSFLTNLMNREQRNYQFDFLRPQHGLFTYFTQLIEQYSKILMPSKTFLAQLEKEVVDSKLILEKVRYRTEWTKIVEAEKRKEEEEAERERIQYAQIDWHDFVIVETVDYQPTETGQFPPPTTPEQVGSRLLLQQRIESNGAEAVEMDVESDEEKAEEPEAEKTKETSLPPLPPSLDNVLIRKDYNPKAAKVVAAQPSAASRPDSYFISPMTGEKIPAEKLQDHMRFSLLDPRWVEQRDRTIQEKTQQEEVYAQGSAIEDSLKHLAERRTDIFGSGDAETSIGRKIGEEEKKPEKVTWDGHTNSVEATTRAARANITIEEQIHQIHKTHGLLPENDKDKIGPTVQSSSGGHQQNQPPKLQHPPPPLMNTAMPMRPQMMPPILPSPHHQPDPYMIPGNMGLHMYNVPMAPPPLDPMMQMRLPPAAPDQLEPAYKKARTEDSFIPESEFLQNNPPNVSVKIQVPHSSEKSEWRLNGQVINLTLPYTDVFSVVKAKIHELTNMPPGKQKLQYEGIFVKDSNSLAFYNIPSGASIILGLKERGGRALLEAKIKELEKTVEAEMRVDPKYHHLFVARRAAVCKQLYDDYGGVNVSFPPLGGGGGDKATPTSDRVQLKGAPECVEAVKGRIAEIIADHEAQVTIEVEVEAVHHRGLLTGGPRSRVNGLQAEHDVRIKFPARPKTEKELQQQQANGGGENQAAPEETEEEKQARAERANTVLISGRAENCEAARRALLALVPVTATVAIPYEFHRYVIGQKGVGVRELMDRCNVNIRVPPQADKSDLIYVTGSPEAVERAREELAKRLAELEGEKADRQARSYSLSFPVNPVHHPKIIGKKGAVISKIRTKHNVQINVPESGRGGGNGGGGEAGDLITVIGYEKDALAAKETILAIVKEQEDLVTEELSIDNRIHSRLIGGRGAAIRKVMSQFKVDIRFPKTNAAGEADPDLVLITGLPEAVEEAREHLLEVADTYLDDIDVQYQPPTDHQFHINFEELSATATVKDSKDHHGGGGGGRDGGGGGGKGGFQVRGGPWEKKNKGGGGHNGGLPNQQHNNGPAPDTNNAQEFPAFGGGPGSADPSSPTADGGLGDDQMNTVGTAWARKNGFN